MTSPTSDIEYVKLNFLKGVKNLSSLCCNELSDIKFWKIEPPNLKQSKLFTVQHNFNEADIPVNYL